MVPIGLQIDAHFLEEEDKCGFHVTHEKKELWAVELDLLYQFDQVCKKHGLHYCVGAGTLLGAVRHKGFIPWDDDIDVYMLRDQYDQFCRLAGEFQHPYFLQTSYTERNMLRSYARLRNSMTTGVTKIDCVRDVNKGIFIDVFPIDGISSNSFLDAVQRRKNDFCKFVFRIFNETRLPEGSKNARKDRKSGLKKLFVRIFASDKDRFFRSYEKNLKKYSVEKTELWGNRTIVFGCPKSRRPKKDYMETIPAPFEMLEIPIPRNYDEMLRQQYGDYMKIPENKNGSVHGELIISTDYAYDDPRRTQD